MVNSIMPISAQPAAGGSVPGGSPPTFVHKACCLVVLLGLCSFELSGRLLIAKQKKVPRIVTGAVLDDRENAIVGASVVLTDLQTGKKVATYTKEGGLYQFSDLLPSHDYEVKAEYKDASSEVRKASSFDTRNRIVLNLKIGPPKT